MRPLRARRRHSRLGTDGGLGGDGSAGQPVPLDRQDQPVRKVTPVTQVMLDQPAQPVQQDRKVTRC